MKEPAELMEKLQKIFFINLSGCPVFCLRTNAFVAKKQFSDKYGKIRKFGKGFFVREENKGSISGQKKEKKRKKVDVRARTHVREQNKEQPKEPNNK